MAKRILDLAKELKLDANEVLRIARDCNIAAGSPTSMLDVDDQEKIRKAVQGAKRATKATGVGKTLTLNRPMLAGQGARSVDGRGRKVEVRRRRAVTPAKALAKRTAADAGVQARKEAPQSPIAPAAKSPTKPVLSPAQRAAQAVQAKKDEAATGKVAARAARKVESAQQRPAVKPEVSAQPRKPAVSAGRRPAAQSQRRTTATPAARSGPRTTIRSGLTPAQIAAKKAPRSTMKELERDISEERKARRSVRQQQRPAVGGPVRSRAPSVAVAPQVGMEAPAAGGGARKRGGGGRVQRRLSPAEKAARRAYAEKRHAILTQEEEDRMARLARGDRKRRKQITKDDADFVVREVEITDPILVSELANRMAIKGGEVVKKLFEMGMPVTVNESIDAETAVLIVEEFGHKPKVINAAEVEDVLIDHEEDDPEALEPRPPVVVVMGHVDHGKTSILDALRRANVAAGEAGGITQHIGAYLVKLESGDRVVFIDTPGHEAFTGLRARGAKLTDVAVLVVAADDGVKPQTVEAINHAKAANVPIIVAINKMDKDGADPERVKRQLAEHELIPEEWGGDTIMVPVSAKTGEGLDELLEMLALQTEILELRANPQRRGRGIVIESRLDRGRGPVATVLVQNGTFHRGDIVVVGAVMGRIRAIVDENGVQHRTAGPSIPFEMLGLESVPEAGQEIAVVENEKQARDIVRYRQELAREKGLMSQKRASLDELFAAMQSGMKEVPVVIKGDVTGSVEAMAESLAKVGTDEVQVKVVHKGIGGITESDIMLASASNAIVIGFNVRPEAKAKKLAEQEGVDVRFYKVIYDAIDDIRDAMRGMLAPDQVEKVIGSAEVREVFNVPKVGAVAGCYVTDGYVTRGAKVRVLRDGVLVYDGNLASLKRFKDDVREVKSGYECGIGVEKFNDVKVGDTFEFYLVEEVAAKL
ncbi:MAG: translation initiation factor IF-2 [Zetaproteobacteria bacterium]|nr:MAG: translation initiation factor IF-2 [Zetaproteobacteria bacterium]